MNRPLQPVDKDRPLAGTFPKTGVPAPGYGGRVAAAVPAPAGTGGGAPIMAERVAASAAKALLLLGFLSSKEGGLGFLLLISVLGRVRPSSSGLSLMLGLWRFLPIRKRGVQG